jgi:hypothetical protein
VPGLQQILRHGGTHVPQSNESSLHVEFSSGGCGALFLFGGWLKTTRGAFLPGYVREHFDYE